MATLQESLMKSPLAKEMVVLEPKETMCNVQFTPKISLETEEHNEVSLWVISLYHLFLHIAKMFTAISNYS